jgi:hypothetical protein
LELKLICYCGQKYKFDVEPVNGLMPFTVKCPICNLDGTARANEMLAHLFAVPPKPPAPAQAKATTLIPPAPAAVPPPQSAVAPPPIAATAPPQFKAPPPPVAAAPAVPAMQHSATAAAVGAPPTASSATVSSPPKAPNPGPEKQKSLTKKPMRFNLGLGMAGAAVGSLVGCGLMYGISHYTHFRYLPIGVVVGVAAGYGAQWLARGCSATLGIATAVIAGGLVAGTLWFMYGDFVPIDTVSIVFGAGVAYLASSGLMAAKPRPENR